MRAGAARRLVIALVTAAAAFAVGTPVAQADTSWFVPPGGATASSTNPDPAQTLQTQVVSDGVTSPAKYHYDFTDPFPDLGDPRTTSGQGDFTFETTANATGPVALNWNYVGFSAYASVSVKLDVFDDHGGGSVETTNLVTAGPTSCCATPSLGFHYYGKVVLPNVQNGDHYGFHIVTSNGDSNSTLTGTLSMDYVVDTTADMSGGACDANVANDCSLRNAIQIANASPYPDRIVFDIPGLPPSPSGDWPIQVGSVDGFGLPAITDTVSIDGTTQPGWLGPPVIRVDNAATTTPSNGLELDAGASGTALHGDGSTITGLAVTRFGSPFKSGILVGADYATVNGNYVGTDNNGDDLLGNDTGITVDASNVTIGGTTQADRNVISGNHNAGIELVDGSTEVVAGNYIGVGPDGLAGLTNDGDGILIDPGVEKVTIGGGNPGAPDNDCTGACNVISANDGAGIRSTDDIDLVVSGNWVGVELNSAVAAGNYAGGILVSGNSGGNAVIGGTTAQLGNLVSGNNGDGIAVTDAGPGAFTPGAFTIQGNIVGMDGLGAQQVPNATNGIRVSGVSQALIGGSSSGAGNLVSGNFGDGILVAGASDAVEVLGNTVGENASGTSSFGNGNYGIHVFGATNTIIGGVTGTTPAGPCTGDCNVVAGQSTGIEVENDGGVAASHTTLLGNYVGLTKDGLTGLFNQNGVVINSDHATVGGTDPHQRNVIADSGYGLVVNSGADTTTIVGNYIGTDATGTDAIANTASGIFVPGGSTNTIIGVPGGGNLISGNGGAGIDCDSASTTIQANTIGLASDGETALGNGGYGIFNNATGNAIGGTSPGAGNVIAANGSNGVSIGGAGNTVQGNLIGTNLVGARGSETATASFSSATGPDRRYDRGRPQRDFGE